jgi:hypothetical protein
MNNLKQMGLATVQFHDANRQLPPALGVYGGARGTAHFFILPYMEQENVYAQAAGDSYNARAQPVKTFGCPSDPSAPPTGTTGSASYNGISVNILYQGLATTSYAINYRVVLTGGKTMLTGMPDGTSNTILFGERYQVTNYLVSTSGANGTQSVSGWAAYWVTEGGTGIGDAGVPTEFSFDWSSPIFGGPYVQGTTVNGAQPYRADNQGCPAVAEDAVTFNGVQIVPGTGESYQVMPTVTFQVAPSSTTSYECLLQTPHHAGMPVALGDGSVRLVSASITQVTWAMACAPADGHPLASDW